MAQLTKDSYRVQRVFASPDSLAEFTQFAHRVSADDGTAAFSEQTLVDFSKASASDSSQPQIVAYFSRLIQPEDTSLIGVALAVLSDDPEGEEATGVVELAVDPRFRHCGVGGELAKQLASHLRQHRPGTYHVWVHQILGDQQENQHLAVATLRKRFAAKQIRELHKLQLPLNDSARDRIADLASVIELPKGLSLTTFIPAADDALWLRANSAAFAHHPEQGSLTQDDLAERMEADWFRAEGFFLAKDSESKSIAGFHWTKIPAQQRSPYTGEVYVVGVDPRWQGKKLGYSLTVLGLDYLARAEYAPGHLLEKIVLYVDADNTAAVNLYRSLGFVSEAVDLMYAVTLPSQPTLDSVES